MVEDHEMAGVEVGGIANGGEAELSDDASEDLEGESSGSEDEELAEEDVEGAGEADDVMEVDDVETPAQGLAQNDHHQDTVMAH